MIQELEAWRFFHYFQEISKIPHGSNNIDKISDYLFQFAKEQGLYAVQDEAKNVLIVKEATPGYENEPPIIMQGHMDMVAVKEPDCEIDMTTQGLELGVEGDVIYAKGTSLGGDDGIAVAYGLALLESKDIPHPKMEWVFTVDEEIGLDGAKAFDGSLLTGRRMINIDSEEEGIFCASCAGGIRAYCKKDFSTEKKIGTAVELRITGLLGGHSGCEIHKDRGNSNILMGRALMAIANKLQPYVIEIQGGTADNVIPSETCMKLLFSDWNQEKDACQSIVAELEKVLQSEYQVQDSGLKLQMKELGQSEETVFCIAATNSIAHILSSVPNGVQAMSQSLKDLVETSLNLGVLNVAAGQLLACFSVRSSVDSKKRQLLQKLTSIMELCGGEISFTGDYPGWEYKVDSPLRNKMVEIYERMYQKSPQVVAIHAGLECGLFAGKIPGLDCISLGPDMKDIHSTKETLSISSSIRVWEYLLEVLKEK